MFTRKQLAGLLIPLVLEQTLSVTIGLADTLMVAPLGEAAMSGVSLVDAFNTLILLILAALAAGGSVVTSQYVGRRDWSSVKKTAAQIILSVLVVSCLVGLLVICLRNRILGLIYGALDSKVMGYARTYFFFSALSYPFMGLYIAGAALFRVVGDSRISMMASFVMNVTNIAGNALLIYGLRLGVAGAALSSLASRAAACLAVMLLLQKKGSPLRIDSPALLKPDRGMIRRILAIGIPNGIENGMFQIGKLSVSSLTSTLGTAAIAANAAGNSFCGILNIPANAIGLAVITIVGQCLGAGKKEQAAYYAKRLLWASFMGAWLTNLSSLLVFNRLAVSWFHLSAEAADMCLEVLTWFNVVSLFLWPSSFTLPNILRAGGDARYTMEVSVFSMWVFRVLLSYLLAGYLGFGLLGVWMGMFVDWGFRSLFFMRRFLSGRWMEHKVI